MSFLRDPAVISCGPSFDCDRLPDSSGFLRRWQVRLGGADHPSIGPFRVTKSDLSSWNEPIPIVRP